MANTNLTKAKSAKNDEFYTRMEDIASECAHYKDQFKGKVKSIHRRCADTAAVSTTATDRPKKNFAVWNAVIPRMPIYTARRTLNFALPRPC